MEIVVSSSLSFHVQNSKEDVFEDVLRVRSSSQDDEDGSICKRIENNKRTDDLQESR
jgi:hypothetical protein